MPPFGRPEGEICEGPCKRERSKSNSLRVHFALVFLPHASFSFRGRMGAIERGEESGTECVAPTVFIARRSDQNDQWTTK